MDYELTLTKTLRRAVDQFGDKEIVTKLDDGGYHRYTYSDAYERICQLAHALDDYGLDHGDRVSVMATNHYRHYELYYGPSCSGRSIHMTNHRLPDEHLTTIIDEAEDRVLFFDEAFLDTVERIAPELETVEQYVVLDESVPRQTSIRSPTTSRSSQDTRRSTNGRTSTRTPSVVSATRRGRLGSRRVLPTPTADCSS